MGSIWPRLARSGCRDRSGWLEQGTLRAPARSGCLVLAALDAPGLDFGSRNGSIFVYFRCMHACDGSCMRGRQNTAKTDTKRTSVLSHDQQKVSENRFERYSKRFLRDERARDGRLGIQDSLFGARHRQLGTPDDQLGAQDGQLGHQDDPVGLPK